jgi:hypothetical protein
MLLRRTFLGMGALLWAATPCQAAPADLSGSWRLNVKKSTWSSVRRPSLVVLDIRHHEPSIEYSGVVDHAEEETRYFTFAGSIDGKPYPGTRSYGPGTMTLERMSDEVIVSTFRSEDGKYVETTEIRVARDRRTLTQRIRVTSPQGRRSWVEVYERRTASHT